MALDFTAEQNTLAEIYKITMQDGSIAYFTSHDANITYGGNTYQAIPIKRTSINYHTNLEIDKVDISFGITGVTIGAEDLSVPQIIRREFMKNAHVELWVVDYVALDDDKLLFEGWVSGNVTYDGSWATIEVGSLLDKLQEKFPKVIYSEFCNHNLYDSYCALTKDDYKQSGNIDIGSDDQNIYDAIFLFSNEAEGYWEQGEIKMTSGDNDAISKTIIKHYDGYVKLLIPYPESVQVADTFDAWPGCDKSGATCDTKFSNYANFLGFEYIPSPETVLY